jgi:hypothetical protein
MFCALILSLLACRSTCTCALRRVYVMLWFDTEDYVEPLPMMPLSHSQGM